MKKKLDLKTKILRKKLMIVPPVVIPFLAFGFYSEGGGKSPAQTESQGVGYNTELPTSSGADIVENKQTAYKNDKPSYMSRFNLDELPEVTSQRANENNDQGTRTSTPVLNDPNADILAMYEEHNQTLMANRTSLTASRPQTTVPVQQTTQVVTPVETVSGNTAYDVVEQPATPEQDTPKRRSLFNDNIGGGSDRTESRNEQPKETSIAAVVHGNQTVSSAGSGTRVKLRTTQAGTINGVHIPANTVIYGNGAFANDRLVVSIVNVTVNNRVVPLMLKVHDASDANMGIRLTMAGVAQEARTMETAQSDGVRTASTAIGATGIVGSVVSSAGNVVTNVIRQKGNRDTREVDLTSNYKLILMQ